MRSIKLLTTVALAVFANDARAVLLSFYFDALMRLNSPTAYVLKSCAFRSSLCLIRINNT
ncbi:MAG: hypothetical protein PHQ35_10075 [Phycisphaerae bacterium]|nr:hypothetical protein [Phycisphaerae bacterium]MDD5381962.1 hypothetical protein [Phycisphaerae bacterium]